MLIIASKPGQLGNSLFLFANFIACAIENDLRVMNLAFDDYADLFQATAADPLCRYPLNKSFLKANKRVRRLLYKTIYYSTRLLVRSKIRGSFLRTVSLDWEERCYLDSPEFLGWAKQTRFIFAQGWLFKAPSQLEKHADRIREFFKPLETIQQRIALLISKAKRQCDILIGVHIRQGDYKTFKGGKYLYETEEYLEAMRKVERLFPDSELAFLVCSNVKQDEKLFSNLECTFGLDSPIEDMYSLAQCDYIIGPSSTFTMWASFYGKVPLYIIEDSKAEISLDNFKVGPR